MTTLLIAFEKRADMTTEAFRTYYREEHAPIVAELPNLVAYDVTFPRDPDRSPFDGVARLRFEDADAFGEAMESAVAERMQADAAEFIDEDSLVQLVGDREDMLETGRTGQ